MDTFARKRRVADLRDHLAEERTFLAWIRTGLTLMGFGFVVARLGLFLALVGIAMALYLALSAGRPMRRPPQLAAAGRPEHDGRRGGHHRLSRARGLFTAHITGNLVIVAAHYVTGGFSEVGPLLSVPVFIAVLGVVMLACGRAEKAGHRSRRALLSWCCKRPYWRGAWGSGSGLAPSPTPTARSRCSWACSESRQWLPRMCW